MDELVKHLENILEIDRASLALLALLCAVSAFALREYMAQPIMAIFAYPLLLLLSISAKYAILLQEVYDPRRLDLWLMWTILAAICGNIAGIALVGGIGRLREALTRVGPSRRPVAPTQVRR